MKNILITGGAGYIGSHATVVLGKAGYRPIILDNFSNSHSSVLDRIQQLAEIPPLFIPGDIRDEGLLANIFQEYECEAVMHFAGLKAVGDSMTQPLEYYDVNVRGSVTLLAAMKQANVKRLIFSSSAAVYGVSSEQCPIQESARRSTVNPYGRSKLMIEEMLEDLEQADSQWSIARLRYFNPIGAHSSGLLGETPQGTPNNLMPYIMQVAFGLREKLSIFGGDYPTEDGTAVRDYIHVMDLAEGHVAALKWCETSQGMMTVNLGTGTGTTVLQMVKACEVASGRDISYEITERRPGDVATCWADPAAAAELLGWRATRSLEEMCRDSWRWQQNLQKNQQ